MTPVRLEWDLDAETAVAAAVAFHAADPAPTAAVAAARWRNRAVGLVVAVWFGVLYALDVPAGPLAVFGATLGLAFAYANWAGWKARQTTAVVIRRLFADPAGAAALGRRTVEFARNGFTIDTDYSREEFSWSAVFRVRETPDFLLLTLPGPRSLALPRSAFPSAAAFADFADEVRVIIGGTV